MYKYEMDPTKIVGATDRTQDAGRTDGRIETPPNHYMIKYDVLYALHLKVSLIEV